MSPNPSTKATDSSWLIAMDQSAYRIPIQASMLGASDWPQLKCGEHYQPISTATGEVPGQSAGHDLIAPPLGRKKEKSIRPAPVSRSPSQSQPEANFSFPSSLSFSSLPSPSSNSSLPIRSSSLLSPAFLILYSNCHFIRYCQGFPVPEWLSLSCKSLAGRHGSSCFPVQQLRVISIRT